MTSVDADRFRRLLLEERQRLADSLEFLHAQNPGSLEDETGEETHFDEHLADSATATHDREVDYTLEETTEQVIAQVDAALVRLDNGTYGVCRVCGREIGEERLEARPWTDLCIDDARKLGP